MTRTKVLLVDDQVLFVESLRKLLQMDAPHIEVIGTAYDGRQAIELALATAPDVVLMDVRMPEVDGVEATRRVKEAMPTTHIVILTKFDDDEYVHRALRFGADGYLLKDTPPGELIASIEAVRQGGVTISPAVARKLVASSAAGGGGAGGGASEFIAGLSRREKDVLALMGDGYDNGDIAETLCLGEQTVKNYVSTIYDKLHVHKRSQAVRLAKEANLSYHRTRDE